MALPGFYQVLGSLRASWTGMGKMSRALQSLWVSLQLNYCSVKSKTEDFLQCFAFLSGFVTNPCPLKVFKIEWSQIKWIAGQVQNGVIVSWIWVYFPSLFLTIESIWKIQGAPAFLTVLRRQKSSSLSSLKLWTLWSTKDCTWNQFKKEIRTKVRRTYLNVKVKWTLGEELIWYITLLFKCQCVYNSLSFKGC